MRGISSDGGKGKGGCRHVNIDIMGVCRGLVLEVVVVSEGGCGRESCVWRRLRVKTGCREGPPTVQSVVVWSWVGVVGCVRTGLRV